jgi:hypothetical protein
MIKEGKIRFATLVGNILKRYDTVRHIEKLMYLSSTAATFPLISIFKMLFNVGSPVSTMYNEPNQHSRYTRLMANNELFHSINRERDLSKSFV